VGYIKVSHVGFAWADYQDLLSDQRFVDPLAVARLREAINTVVWMLPGSNIQYKSALTAREGFRLRLHELLQKTKISKSSISMYHSLFNLYALSKGTKHSSIFIKECPECHHKHDDSGLCFSVDHDELVCAQCGRPIYASDILGFHQEFEEHGANDGLFTRIMSVLEALLLMQRWDTAMTSDPEFAADTLFFYDGLLALYGECSWLCQGLLAGYHKLKGHLIKNGLKPPLVVGVSKTGQLMRHAEAILGDLSANDIVPISLEYRKTLLRQPIDDPQKSIFRSKWGQDFIWRTGQGKPIVFSLPFWTTDVLEHAATIHDASHYPELPEILGALNDMDCTLYPSAFIPIVLAHEEASISWEPGGRLLTEATKRALLSGQGQD
jgi:ribosomal protein S27E